VTFTSYAWMLWWLCE